MTRSWFRITGILLFLVLIAIPPAHAAGCPEGCTCMLPTAASENGYSACSGMQTTCGYDMYGSAKYCYAKARVTQKPVGTAFTGSDCPSVSGLVLIGGTSLAQAGLAGREGIHCQYSLPGTCREQPCTAILRVERTGSPGAAGSLMNTISPPGTIASLQRIYTIVDSGQTVDHRYVIFKNNPGNSAPPAVNFAGALTYRDVYVIQAESGQGYWVSSDPAARSTLTSLENAGKSVVDRKAGAGVPGVSSPPAGSFGNSLFPTGSQEPAVMPDVTGSGFSPEEILLNLIQGLGALGNGFNLLSPLDINWDAVPGAMSGSLTPAMLGAFGALLGGSVGALSLVFPGGFPEAGGQGGDGGEGTGSDEDFDSVSTDGSGQIYGGQNDNPDTVFHGGQGPGGCS